MKAIAVAAAAVLMVAGCNIGESATELGQNAADQARRSTIDRLEDAGDCRTLRARLNDYEASGFVEVTEYAREAMKRVGCDE